MARKPRKRATKLRPEQKIGEKDGLDRHWRGLFLDTLAETSNVSEAARVAGASPSRAYKTRREDRDFARDWAAALVEGYAHLEMETLERLRNGVPADGPRFDIANALRLLTLHKETVARERAREEMEDEEEILAGIERKIEMMRTRERETAALLADDGPALQDDDA